MTVADALAAQTTARARLRERTSAVILANWDALGGYRDADVEIFLTRVLPMIQSGQLTTAQVTAQFIGRVISEVTGAASEAAVLGSSEVTSLRPVDDDVVYTRPFVTVRTALSQGAPLAVAVATARDRLERLVLDDLSLAHRRASLISIGQRDEVESYRRVIRPEIAAGGVCGLCITAASRVYKRGDLLPIHSRCNCEVMPVIRAPGGRITDPGARMNDLDIETVYRDAGSTLAADLKKTRYTIKEHGELGPMLTTAGEKFTTIGDIAA